MSAFLPASVPPGWYPDPEGHPQQRWWTGSGWTANTAPSGSAPAAPAQGFSPINAAPPAPTFRSMSAASSPAAALPFAPSPAASSAQASAPFTASQPFATSQPFAPTALPYAPAPERTEQPAYEAHPYQPQAATAFPTSVAPVQPGQIASPPSLPGMAALPAYAAGPQSALAGLPGPAAPAALPTAAAPLAIAPAADPGSTTSYQSTTVQSTTTTVTEHTTTETTAMSAPAPAPAPVQEAIPGLSYPSATSPDNFSSPVSVPFAQRFASTAYASAQDYAIAETKAPESSTFTSSPYVAGTPFESAPAAPFVPSDADGTPALAPFPAPSTTTPAIPAFSVTAFAQAPIATAPAAPSTASFAQQSLAAKSLSAGSVNTQFSSAAGTGTASAQSFAAQSFTAQSMAAQSTAAQSTAAQSFTGAMGTPQYSRTTEFSLGTFEPTVQYEALKGDSRKRMAREPRLTYTAASWAIVLTPLVVVAAAVGLVTFATEYYTSVVQLGLVALGAVASLLFALGDRRTLMANGHKRAASAAWILLTPLVYLTVRYIRTRSETRKGIATLLVWLLVAAGIAAGYVLLPELAASVTAFSL